MDIARFKKTPVMGILRGAGVDVIEPLVETVVSAGLETLEVAMNTRDTRKVIRRAVKAAGPRLMIGAGTVLNLESLKASLDSGATMAKVFPSAFFGSSYFKELKGPFNNIELMACGGVTVDNVKSYFREGASAVAFGGGILRNDLLKKRDFKKIGRLVSALATGAAKR